MKIIFALHGYTEDKEAELKKGIGLGLEIEGGYDPVFESEPVKPGGESHIAISFEREEDIAPVLTALHTGRVSEKVTVSCGSIALIFSYGDFVGNRWSQILRSHLRNRR